MSERAVSKSKLPEDFPLKNWLGRFVFWIAPKTLPVDERFVYGSPGLSFMGLVRHVMCDRRVRWFLISGWICEMIYAAFFLMMPLFLGHFVELLIEGGEVLARDIVQLISIAAVAFTVVAFVNYNGVRLVDRGRGLAEVQTRRQVTRWAMGHSAGWFSVREAGQIAHRVAEIARHLDLSLGLFAYQIVPVCMYLITAEIVVASIDLYASVFFIVWGIGFVSMSLYFGTYSRRFAMRSVKRRAIASGLVTDAVINNNLVRLFGMRDFEDRKISDVSMNVYESYMQSSSWARTKNLFRDFSITVLIVGLIGILGHGFITERISAGGFASGMGVLFVLMAQIRGLHHLIRDIMEYAGGVQEGLQEIGTPHDIEDIAEDAPTLSNLDISLKDVTFNYENTQNVLRGVSLDIPQGQKIGIVGHSGAGKTTLMSVLLRLWDVSSGQITIGEHDIREMPMDALRTHMALIPQDTTLFHRSLMDNIRYGNPQASDEDVIEAAKRAHADEFISQLPKGYNTLVGERGVKLSGGQRQRIAIARAILKDAPILILDEATSALDSESEKLIQDSLKELMVGKTVIAIAHRLSTIAHLDRLIVMEDGRIIEDGSHEELRVQGGIYASLWDMQSGGFLGG